jgi:predicted ATPase/transcriptional regulator with GAF, ATPase, and Fis domain
MLTVDEIQKTGTTVNRISLMPLNLQHINQFVSDSLTCAPEKALPLAELVLAKTNGNPFFVGEFLKSLFERKLLEFDHEHFRWKWSMSQIQAQGITDNVVELIVGRVLNLRTELQEVLKFAAYIGNQFELKALAIVCEKSQKETAILLREAIAEGFIAPLGDEYKSVEFDVPELADALTVEYRFSHDRIQQAVYSLVPEPERQIVHLKIGRLLLKEIPPDSQEQKIFDIVNQLNHGTALIHLKSERAEVARLNLIAGKKAKAAAAYEPAFRYLSTGIELLTSLHLHPLIEANQKHSCWQTQYDLALALHVEAAEAAYLCTEFEKMDELVQVVLDQAQDLLDKVKAYEIKIQALIAQNKSLEGVKTGLTALRLLGVRFPEKPNKLEIVLALSKTKFILSGKRIEDLVDLPEMNDPIKLAAIRILMNLGTAAYFSAPDLFPLIVFKGVNLSVKHGNSHESTIAYSSYGIILCAVLGDIETGYRFGQLALRLLSRFNGVGLKSRTLGMVNNFVKHWKEPLRKGLELSLEAFQSGLETGDFEWASYAAQNYCANSFIVGKELGELEEEFRKYSEAIRQVKQEIPYNCNRIVHQAVLNLMGKTESPCRLIGNAYNEQEMLPRHLQANDGNSLFVLYFSKVILCFLFQESQQAIENAAKAEKYLDNVTGEAGFPLFHFYYSLSLLAVFPDTQKLEKKRILKKVAVNQKKMRKWAYHAPINYLHKFYLVEAERCRILGEDTKAIEFYDQAISLAGKHEYINEEALANELAARFYLANNKKKNAEKYMTDARYCYLRWGALAKVKDLDTRYPELLGKTTAETKTETKSFKKTFETTVNGSGKKFDWISVMKVAKAISSEIVLSKLLNKLMRIVIENAGARKGILILQSEGKLFIEAESSVEQDSIMLLHSVPVEKDKNLPLSIINYVSKTHEYVILNNPAQDSVFMNDAYIIAHRPKAILCGPLLHKSKLIGMLYLENSLLTDAFATKRLEVIKLLGSQIAVSLENARLYTGMEAHTEKIKAINLNLKREIAQRKKAEAELTRYRDNLEELVEQRTAELEESQRALANLERDIEKRHRFQNIVGKSEKMQGIYSLIEDLADLSATVLITGESGTGKELVAEALHYGGKRRDKPFVKVNCSALSETILESELFGHVKGAFTGADKDKVGRFQKAGDGTIFLDEIGDISPYFQKRLLRVLQEREFEQVGDTTPKKMKARVLAATNQDLLEKVRGGEFRKDLYYRLRVVALNLPPLRDRREDIPLLLRHFLKHFSNELGKEIMDISKDVLKQFMECPWPGNIRELKNTLEHICILCKDSTITVDDLPADFTDLAGPETSFGIGDADTPQAILLALEEAKWNKTHAAHLLGISRRTLYRKLEEHNMMESIKIH